MHHIQGNAYANDLVTCSSYNQAKTSQDLSKLFSHLIATLFSGDQRGVYDLWHRVEQEVVHNQRLEVHYCLTKANRVAFVVQVQDLPDCLGRVPCLGQPVVSTWASCAV